LQVDTAAPEEAPDVMRPPINLAWGDVEKQVKNL